MLDVRPLPDGGLLVSLGGRSHLVYAKEESSGLRLVLNGATCQFSNEYDPTTLRAPMSGKLARYLVEDGARVAAGMPDYAAFMERAEARATRDYVIHRAQQRKAQLLAKAAAPETAP